MANAVSIATRTSPAEGVSVEVEAALLDVDQLAAIKLALKTKRLPLTPDDVAARGECAHPLHERYSSGLSGIPLSEYYAPYAREAEFPPATLRLVEFLVAHRRAFKERTETGLNDARQVGEFAQLCGDERRLRALFIFTCADHADWESPEADPARWFNTRELYTKTLARFRPAADHTRSLRTAGYDPEELSILKDFGEDFFAGVYRQYANYFGAHLLRLARQRDVGVPKASILRDSTSIIVGVAARDYRGLAASISGAFWHRQIDLRQAHLFSAAQHGLALDFFHLAPRGQPLSPSLTRFIEDAIQGRRYIADEDEASLPRVTGQATLREWRPGQYCLRFESAQETSGLMYALTYKVFRHLQGNIFGLTAHTARGKAFVSLYHSLPAKLSLVQAQAITTGRF